MASITTRAGKGSPLTNAEVDANFTNLNGAVQPAGGTAGQVLSKIDGTDFNSQWVDASGGGGSVPDASDTQAGIVNLTPGQSLGAGSKLIDGIGIATAADMYITPSTASTSTPSILVGVGAVDMGSGTNSIAIGNTASAEITAVAVGANATAYSHSTAIGPDSSAMYDGSTAIGNGATATASNQMVLGGTSVTETYLRGAIFVGSGLAYAGSAGQVLISNGPYSAPNWNNIPGPALSLFTVYPSATRSVSALTTTKILIDSSNYDVAGALDDVNNRAKPVYEGFYQINFTVQASAGFSTGLFMAILKKNGTIIANGSTGATSTSYAPVSTGSALVFARPSDNDYFELFVLASSACTVVAGTNTRMDSFLVYKA
jgi:hypothetical protein